MKFTLSLVLIAALALGSNGSILPLQKRTNNNNDVTNEDTSTTNPNFGSALLSFLAAYKNILPCGVADWNLPAMEPFTMESLPFDFHSQYYSFTGVLSNLVISGISDYRFIKYTYDPNTGVNTFDVIYYDLQFVSEYTMEAWAMMAGYNSTVTGNGPLNYQVKNARFIGQFTIGSNDGDGTMISDFSINVLIGDIIVNNWNYQWDISFNNFVNTWVRDFILMWVQQSQELINDIYKYDFIAKENQQLQNISMTEIIDFFVQQTKFLNTINCQGNKS